MFTLPWWGCHQTNATECVCFHVSLDNFQTTMYASNKMAMFTCIPHKYTAYRIWQMKNDKSVVPEKKDTHLFLTDLTNIKLAQRHTLIPNCLNHSTNRYSDIFCAFTQYHQF